MRLCFLERGENMSEKVIVAIKRPGQRLEIAECIDDLKSWQAIVGGWLEAVPFGNNGIIMWCNEEGLLHNLPFNFKIAHHMIVGNVFFTRSDEEGEIASLNMSDIRILRQLLG